MVAAAIAWALAWAPMPEAAVRAPAHGRVRFSLPSDVPRVIGGGGTPRGGSLIAVPDSAPLRAPDQPAVSSIPPYELVGPRRDEPLPPGVIAYSEGLIRAADRRYSFTFLHGPNWRPWLNPSPVMPTAPRE